MVHHGRLLMKMRSYGLSKSALKLIASYLDSRMCSTMANDQRSAPHTVTYGVPQGSVLGPLLFLFYINDLPDIMENTEVILYADDLVLISRGMQPDRVQSLLQSDLQKVEAWCKVNRLTPNIGKTKSMWFVPNNKIARTLNLRVELNNQILGDVKEFKYLGLWLDRDLKFEHHLEDLDHRIGHKLYQLRRNRRYLNVDGATSIYKQALVPIIEYGDFIIDSGPVKLIRKLQTHQNNGLRICMRKKIGEVSTNYLHSKCKVERLELRRKRHLACLMYRHANTDSNCVTQHHRTRSDAKKKLLVERPKKEKYRKGPLYRGMQIWDEIPPDIQKCEGSHLFKIKIKTVIK